MPLTAAAFYQPGHSNSFSEVPCIGSFLPSLMALHPYQTLITFYLDSCNCISTGFQSSSILALKSQIKHLWSGPPPAQNLHLCNHAQRWVFQQADHRPLPDGSWNHISTFLAGFLLSKAVPHAFELHREGCHASHLLTFQMPQIKENIND